MNEEQVAELGPALTAYLGEFRPYFVDRRSAAHLSTYCRGLMSEH